MKRTDFIISIKDYQKLAAGDSTCFVYATERKYRINQKVIVRPYDVIHEPGTPDSLVCVIKDVQQVTRSTHYPHRYLFKVNTQLVMF